MYYFNKFVHTEELSRAILFSSDDCDLFDVSFEHELFEYIVPVLSKEQ